MEAEKAKWLRSLDDWRGSLSEMLGKAKRLASLMVLESLKIDALGVSWEAFGSLWEL